MSTVRAVMPYARGGGGAPHDIGKGRTCFVLVAVVVTVSVIVTIAKAVVIVMVVVGVALRL